MIGRTFGATLMRDACQFHEDSALPSLSWGTRLGLSSSGEEMRLGRTQAASNVLFRDHTWVRRFGVLVAASRTNNLLSGAVSQRRVEFRNAPHR